jgi:hypothetical protein
MQQFSDFRLFLARLGLTGQDFFAKMEVLPKVSEDGPWIAGGALRRTIKGQSADSDFDFFFKSEQQLKFFEATLATLNVKSKTENENNLQYVVTCEIKRQVENNTQVIHKNVDIIVQLIKVRYYNSLEEVLDSFDYTICQFGYDGKKLVCGDYALYDLARDRLVINRITFPVASLRRMIKYTKQGFYACNGCLNQFLTTVSAQPELLENKFKYID